MSQDDTAVRHARSKHPRHFACWWGESMVPAEVTEVDALSHEDAAVSFLMRKLADYVSHDNAPDPNRIGVVDLEFAEARFVYVKIAVDVRD